MHWSAKNILRISACFWSLFMFMNIFSRKGDINKEFFLGNSFWVIISSNDSVSDSAGSFHSNEFLKLNWHLFKSLIQYWINIYLRVYLSIQVVQVILKLKDFCANNLLFQGCISAMCFLDLQRKYAAIW